MDKAIIIFAKNPVAGKVKTRLAKDIGDEAALKVYENLLTYTRNYCEALHADRFLYYTDFIDENDEWSSEKFEKQLQTQGDLGEKMSAAFKEVFLKGYKKVLIIGTDCPGINASLITEAFHQLEENDICIGPAEDGGYYLLAMKKWHPFLFEDKSWSNPILLRETLDACRTNLQKVAQLKTLFDIDDINDLRRYNEEDE